MSTSKDAKEPQQLSGIKFNIDNLIKSGLLEKEVKLYVNAFPIKFNKDLKDADYSEESHKKAAENVPVINISPIPSLPVEKIKVKKPKADTKKKENSENQKEKLIKNLK